MRYLALTLCLAVVFVLGAVGESSAMERGGEQVITEHGHHGGGWGGRRGGHGGGWGRGHRGGGYGGGYCGGGW